MFNSLGYRTSRVWRDAPSPSGILRNYWPTTRVLPRLIVAGAQKSGTTSLYNLLVQHPCVVAPQLKEPFFWGNDDRFSKGLRFYEANFPTKKEIDRASLKTGARCITVDATTNYLDHPLAAARIKAAIPDVKVVILLRDPVLRAHSHYKMAVRNGVEGLTFKEALALENRRIGEGKNALHNYCRQRMGYRSRGEYAGMLQPWLDNFNHENLLIVCAEDLFVNTEQVLAQVLHFAGLNAHTPPDMKPLNTSTDKALPEESVLNELKKHFATWNHRLENMLNRSFPWSHG